MGLNENGLSPREHAEMRDLVLAGTQRIKPAGTHRNQFVAAAVALVLVGAVTGGAITTAAIVGNESTAPVSTPSPTVTATPTPTPPPTPTPTPTIAPVPPEGIVPFGGECSRLVSDTTRGLVTDGSMPTPTVSGLDHVMPDKPASAALVGGLTCWWFVNSSATRRVNIDVFPAQAVPEDVLVASASFACDMYAMCGRGELRAGAWVYAAVQRWDSSFKLPAEEQAELAAEVDSLLGDAGSHPDADLRGEPAVRSEDWWTIPACESLESVVVETSGMTTPEAGYPTDNYPVGTAWEILVAAGVVQWCPWYSYEGEDATLVELDIQPGVGAPSAGLLERAGAQEITISGADVAYLLGGDEIGRLPKVLVISGPNRLTVGGDHLETVAAAVLAALNAP